jgi:DNA modification methylase
MSNITLLNGDCLVKLQELDDNSVDSIVTDPPYGIDFMGKKWDYDVPSTAIWEQCLRVLKPGGYLLAFAGTRTQHRMAVRIEDAGFEIRDMIAWVYGSGFPKSHNISKALDKMAGAKRTVKKGVKPGREDFVGRDAMESLRKSGSEGFDRPWMHDPEKVENYNYDFEPVTDDAKKWDGWGTALKPALEPITVARKPLEEKTVAANVLKYGTGGINIDESRIATNPDVDDARLGGKGSWKTDNAAKNVYEGGYAGEEVSSSQLGRFPANLIHDGSEEVTELFPEAGKSSYTIKTAKREPANTYGKYAQSLEFSSYDDRGSAARFFYVPKTSKKDRNDGLDKFNAKATASSEFRPNHAEKAEQGEDGNPYGRWTPEKNNHPTVKPTDLMRYLVTMVTPKGGTTLDPFMGSGSTGRGAKLGGFNFIGVELDPDYFEIAKARIDAIIEESTLEEFFA